MPEKLSLVDLQNKVGHSLPGESFRLSHRITA